MNCSYSNLWKITLPIFSFLLIENIIAFTDTAFLGRVGEAPLAAAAIASLYYVTIFIVGFGFSVGSQIFISHLNGEKNFEKIGAIFNNSIYCLFAMALLGFCFTEFFGQWVFSKMVNSPDVINEVMRYMKWRQFGFFAIFSIIAFRSFYVGIARTKPLAYTSWLMGVVNLVLDYVLVFGKFGFPKMEIEGAAIASTISEFSAVVFFFFYTAKRSRVQKFNLRFSKIDFTQIKKIFGLSGWTMAQQFVYVAMWLLLFSFIESFGERPLAQSNIIKSVLMFVYMPMYAFGATMNTVAGNLLGEGRKSEIMPACVRIMKLQFALVVPALVLLCAFPIEILSVYTDNKEILQGIKMPLFCALFTVPWAIPSITLCNLILGFERTKAIFIMECSVLVLYFGGLFFTVYYLSSFPATWTLDGWYWIILICTNYIYIRKFLLPSKKTKTQTV